MMWNLVRSMVNKTNLKPLDDDLTYAAGSQRCSAWSYSYDMNVWRYQEDLKNVSQSNSKSRDEDKLTSEFNTDERHEDEFIFGGEKQAHDPLKIERFTGAFKGALNHNHRKDEQNHRQEEQEKYTYYGPESNSKAEQIANDYEKSVLTDLWNQKYLLEKSIGSLSEEIKNGKKTGTQGKCCFKTQADIIDHLEEFVRKTGLPAIQELEHLRKEYWSEMLNWHEQVLFLK